MTFQWPSMLFALLLLLPLAGLYVWVLRRPPKQTTRYTRVALIVQAAGRAGRWRRHIPAGLFALALSAIMVALARPVAPMPVPSTRNTVVLSIDVSRSMLAEDLSPNRMEAAKRAAHEFVEFLPKGMKVGLVTFSSYATLIVAPTADRARVLEAIDLLHTEFATAIGDGLLEAVWSLPGRIRPSTPMGPTTPPRQPVPPGTVVLLSDGQSNRGVLPTDAARIAREQEVKVYTIGVGTPEGTFLNIGGRSIWVRLDEDTLREMAEIGSGAYYRAQSISELRQVYRRVGRMIAWESKPTEVTGIASGVAAFLLLAAFGASISSVNRIT